jgi:hypothetical protein
MLLMALIFIYLFKKNSQKIFFILNLLKKR